MTATDAPRFTGDLFSEDAIHEPHELYRQMRELGPVVRVEELGMYALPRYAEVRAALGDDAAFTSALGVSFNDFTNQAQQGTTLASDGAEHRQLRTILGQGLNPHALREKTGYVEGLARELVDRVLERDEFDAVPAFAQAMPLTVVPDLLGWEESVRPRLLEWAEAAFDTSGPFNPRNEPKLRSVGEMIEYASTVAAEGRLAPGGLGAAVVAAAERGEVGRERCPALMLDFLGPSLDTTASALGAAFHLFATRPAQWAKLRADPGLIPNAINEIVRWQSPVRFFTRVATREVELGGVTIEAGARTVVMFASANRDERFWERPEEFEVERANASRQVGFGYGVHACAGQGLTRLEAGALLTELAGRVERFEPAGEPRLATNSIIRAFDSVPVRIVRG
ncbi:MAG: cytochrome P450 [Solirubrobacterales bacterium]